MADSIQTTELSKASMLRLLKEQGITDLQKLVQKGLDAARAGSTSDDEPGTSLFITRHYVYVRREF
jgi:hypothetical protein